MGESRSGTRASLLDRMASLLRHAMGRSSARFNRGECLHRYQNNWPTHLEGKEEAKRSERGREVTSESELRTAMIASGHKARRG